MTRPTVVGILREARFSPGRVEDDRAILEETLRNLGDQGCAAATVSGDAPGAVAEALGGAPRVVLAMCEDPSTLDLVDARAGEALVINAPHAIRNCLRVPLVSTLASHGLPQPPFELAPAALPASLGVAPWLKRGDFHATHPHDVGRVQNDISYRGACEEFRHRGIGQWVVQQHIPGVVYKFYGIGEGFFRAFGLPSERKWEAQALARRGARALGLEVYGGDGVVAEDGSLVLIDFNDWPSFSRCRPEAAAAVATYVLDRLAVAEVA